MSIFKSWRERRAAQPSHNPTLLPTIAAYSATRAGNGVAAVETAIGLISRGLAMGLWEGDPTNRAPSLPALSTCLPRALILTGEFIGLIEVRDGEVKIVPTHSPTITGGYHEDTWNYEITLTAPSETTTMRVPSSRVVHVKWGTSPEQPWRGVSPLQGAGLTTEMLARISGALANEAGASSGYILPTPASFFANNEEGTRFFKAIREIAGRMVPFRKMSEATIGQQGAEYRQTRVGFDAPTSALALEEAASQAVLRAIGIPPGLVQRAEGSASREALKIFIYQTLLPLAEIITAEFAHKLNLPRLEINLDKLTACDIQARARAMSALTSGGVEAQDALGIVGMHSNSTQ